MNYQSVNGLYQTSITQNWERPAVSNYKGETLKYSDVARQIAKFHIAFEKAGIEKGDRIALCANNQAHWTVAFLAAMTYGAVPVPLLHEFKPANIHTLVNHSEAKILFVDEKIWSGLSASEMPALKAIVKLEDYSLLYVCSDELTAIAAEIDKLFAEKYPAFGKDNLSYYADSEDELAIINYTSGTSGFSKGVMIPYRAVYSNIRFAEKAVPELNNTSDVVSMLPAAHMYGLMFENLFELTVGAHVHYLTKIPSPKVLITAMQEIKPRIVISVPLVIEKVYKSKVKPVIEKPAVSICLQIPVVKTIIERKICKELVDAFGGNFKEVIIGGAAFNKEVEAFMRRIHFPFTVGYGMTECAPIIGYADWDDQRLYSCGKPALNLEVKVNSPDPENVSGEVLVKGPNVFLGYFNNPEATEAMFTKDGWFRTGDIGVMDKEGYIYLRGRSKCMILGPSGQNIYPEEIEGMINSMDYVNDSLVVEDERGLVAIVYPDAKLAAKDGLDEGAMKAAITASIDKMNADSPAYQRINRIDFLDEDFERTPKKSIKRYLYQRN